MAQTAPITNIQVREALEDLGFTFQETIQQTGLNPRIIKSGRDRWLHPTGVEVLVNWREGTVWQIFVPAAGRSERIAWGIEGGISPDAEPGIAIRRFFERNDDLLFIPGTTPFGIVLGQRIAIENVKTVSRSLEIPWEHL